MTALLWFVMRRLAFLARTMDDDDSPRWEEMRRLKHAQRRLAGGTQ